MYNRKNSDKAETKMRVGEYKDCKEDEITNNNTTYLFREYIHYIRNMKILDKQMINNIRNMSNEEKIEIIIALNDVVEATNDLRL